MGILGKGFGPHEDPNKYGKKFKKMRQTLREKKGLNCFNCGKNVKINLEDIESQIKQRKEVRGMMSAPGTLVLFHPDWGEGSVCKKCEGVLCGRCTKKAEKESGGIGMPCCPKCEEVLEGIDHITD